MSNIVVNYMKVYGNKKNLNKFMNDVAGEKSYFSFGKIIPEPKDTSAWAKDGNPGWYNWSYEHWGTKWDAGHVKLSSEDDHLYYEFITAWSPPFEIYYNLIEKYTELDFNVRAWELVSDEMWVIEAERGNYTKMIYLYVKIVPWRNNQNKILYYEEDLLKNTLRVYKEEIIGGSEKEGLSTATKHSLSVSCDLDNVDEVPPWTCINKG